MQGQLFAALRRTRLVEDGLGWQALQYSRCGRTDKGVSALGQARPLRRTLCERQRRSHNILRTLHNKYVGSAREPPSGASC
jgi:tRNA U38,U39,U40 pseudouridine synthase TruA